MIKHIILWTLKPEYTAEQKEEIKKNIQLHLEELKDKIPGLLDISIQTDNILPSSNADIMLDSSFESEEALKGYAVHPVHVAVANTYVCPYTAIRSCLDFEK
ncbi:MAG: Dabb family protein [Alphaproteobacteria bacterium]|nr:Dabb family protein [Alphaproteobacteria bacterium]